jgi:hypothetical protein
MMILLKSCSLYRATIAKRSLTRTFSNVFFDRVFVNWFYDRICEFVTNSQISSSRTESIECFTNSRFTIVLNLRERFRKWSINKNLSTRSFSQIWWWTRITIFLFLTIWFVLIIHNDTIKQLNNMILRSLQNEMHTLNVVDNIINESRDDEMFAKFLRTLKTSSFSLSELCLKIKTLVMLLQNLYSK